MGLYDTLTVELAGLGPGFQTKSLGCMLEKFRLTREGRLIKEDPSEKMTVLHQLHRHLAATHR